MRHLSGLSAVGVAKYTPEELNTFASISKNFSLSQEVDLSKAAKIRNGNELEIFIPFGQSEGNLSSEEELLKAKENFDKTKNAGLTYAMAANIRGKNVNAKSYRLGDNTKTVFEDGTYMIMKNALDNGEKIISWYNSKENTVNIQKLSPEVTQKEIYIDDEKNYSLFSKNGISDEYALLCMKYTKSDINETLDVCVNLETGIVLYKEKVGVSKEVLSSVELGKIEPSVFDFPDNAKIVEH